MVLLLLLFGKSSAAALRLSRTKKNGAPIYWISLLLNYYVPSNLYKFFLKQIKSSMIEEEEVENFLRADRFQIKLNFIAKKTRKE